MKCKNCGAELMEGIMFCPECGEKNESETANVMSAVYLEKEETPITDNPAPEHIESVQYVTEQVPGGEKRETESIEQETESTKQKAESEEHAPESTGHEAESEEHAPESTGHEAESEEHASESTGQKAESEEQSSESTGHEAESTKQPAEHMQDMNAAPQRANVYVETEPQKKFCPQCGTENIGEALFCGKCGFSFTGGTVPPTQNSHKEKKSDKKGLAIGLAAAGIVAAVGIVGILSSVNTGKGKGGASNLMYLKDNQINIMAGSKTIAIDDDFYESKLDIGLGTSAYPIQYSSDGKYLFYPVDSNYDGYDLYRRKADSQKGEGVKVASKVSSYRLIGSSKIIFLSDDSKLYITNMKDKEKIASDVSWFNLSGDNKYVYWCAYDGDMYVQDIGLKKDKIKVDKETNRVYYVSEDLKDILYVKDDNLYHVKNYEDKEKIASDVSSVRVYEDKNNNDLKIYYTISDEAGKLTYNDIIEDDMASADARMQEPDIKDYQKTTIVDSWWGPRESIETDDKYYQELEKYNEKIQRDYLREYFDDTLGIEYLDLYYYDINKKNSEKIFSNSISDFSSSNGVYTVTYYNLDDINKLKMSEIAQLEYSGLDSKVRETLAGCRKVCAIDGNTETALEIDVNEYSGFGNVVSYVPDNGMLYLMYTNKTSGSTLLSTNLSKDKGKMSEITDEAYSLELVNKNGVYYLIAEDESGRGNLYFNDKMISEDVESHSVYSSDTGAIYYYTDMRNSEGTLIKYEKGKETTISEDVADYYEFDEGKIAILTDYNFNKNRGDLKLYTGSKLKDIDTDVQSILRYGQGHTP